MTQVIKQIMPQQVVESKTLTECKKMRLGSYMQAKSFYDAFGIQREEKSPPKSISYPKEYDNSDEVNILCTQIDLSPSKQSKLIQEWCEILPALDKIKYIWFFSKVPQLLFDAICSMKNLEGVYIKWSSIKDLENIKNLSKLKYLHIGSSSKVTSILPLKSLTHLEWLELESFKKIVDLTPLATLPKLKGLAVTGSYSSEQKIDSLKPLEKLKALEWLNIMGTVVKDASLEPITKLEKLKYLRLSYIFPVEEIARVVAKLTSTQHGITAYQSLDDIICDKCGNDVVILPTGKGKRSFCSQCHPEKLVKLVDDFQKEVQRYE